MTPGCCRWITAMFLLTGFVLTTSMAQEMTTTEEHEVDFFTNNPYFSLLSVCFAPARYPVNGFLFSWWSCIKLPVNRVTGHLCSRCSTVRGCCPQWLQVGCFLCPTCVRCVSSCSGHFWVGLWRPTRLEVVPGPWVLVAAMKGHQWDVHCWWQSVATGMSIPQQCRILPPVALSILLILMAVCRLCWVLIDVRHQWDLNAFHDCSRSCVGCIVNLFGRWVNKIQRRSAEIGFEVVDYIMDDTRLLFPVCSSMSQLLSERFRLSL